MQVMPMMQVHVLVLITYLATSKPFSWFTNNYMKVNPDKCNILLSTKNAIDVHLEGTRITSSSCEKLLGITIDSNLKFDKHNSDLCHRVSKQMIAFCGVTGLCL